MSNKILAEFTMLTIAGAVLCVLASLLSGCGRAPDDFCSEARSQTEKDYGLPNRKLEIKNKNDDVEHTYVYVYPSKGFSKVFDNYTGDEAQNMAGARCYVRYMVDDWNKFKNSCTKQDCIDALLDFS